MKTTINKTVVPALLAAVITVVAACGPRQDHQEETRTNEAILDEVSTIKAIGKVVPAEDWAVIASPVAARVLQILVKEGDTVSADQTLVLLESGNSELNIRKHRARLNQLEAEVRITEADLNKAQLSADNLREIYETSLSLYRQRAETKEKAEADLSNWQQQTRVVLSLQQKIEGQQAAIKEQEIQVRQGENQLSDFRITALRDGIITDLTARVGQSISSSEELGRIVTTTDPVIEAEVDELFANTVEVGQEVILSTVGRPDSLATGHIFYVSPVLSDKSILYETANEGQDRRVRRIKIKPEYTGAPLTINTKVDCEIKIK